MKNGKLSVAFGTGSIEIELADKPEIDLSVADYRLAKKGDKISCQGVQVGENIVQARKVDIELAEPLGGEQKTTRHARVPRKGDAAASAGEQEKPPAEGKDVSEDLVGLLTPKPDAPKVEESFRIEGDSTEFRPSVQGPALTLQRRFGKPQRETVKGIHVVEGKERPVRWQVWTWSTVKVVVVSSKTRFFASGPGSEPKPEERPEQESPPEKPE